MPEIVALKPTTFPWFDYQQYTFSLGVASGSKAFISGHTASTYDPANKRIVISGTPVEQVRVSYEKIAAILDAAGLTLSDVKRVVEYVAEHSLDHYAEMEAVRASVFGENRPAVNTVVVNQLLRPTAAMEIEVVASKEGSDPIRIDQHGRAAYANARAMEDVVYLSSITAVDDDGTVHGGDDLQAQTEFVFAKTKRTLEAAGLSMANIVKTVDYTTYETIKSYKYTGRVRKEYLTAAYPGSAGILLKRLQHPKALISLDVTASRHTPETVNPGWERYGKLTYSPAVKAGKMLFMSGQAALDPETETALFAGDVVAQAEYTYENIVKVLHAAGAGPENLVKTIEYVTPAGLSAYRGVAAVREKVLKLPYPASTGCVCNLLLRPEFEIEVDPLAVLD